MPRCVWRDLACPALLTLLVACAPESGTPPAPGAAAPVSWNAVSQGGLYRLRVEPRSGAVPIAQFHEWTVLVLDASGAPVFPARIGVSGGMPGHGHGLPAQPQVTEHLGDGVYRIEGVKFNMAGPWLLVFGVDAAAGRDRAEIEIDLTF